MAQRAPRSRLIGILGVGAMPSPQQRSAFPFNLELAKSGWIEGQNLAVERAFARGEVARLDELAMELVGKGVDLIFALGPAAAVAAARATREIPIVFVNVTFPVEIGLVNSLARPGGNATGVGYLAGGAEQAAKPLEFLQAIVPDARRVAVIWSPVVMRSVSGPDFAGAYAYVEAGMKQMGFDWRTFEVRTRDAFHSAYAAIAEWKPQALFALATEVTAPEHREIAQFARQRRMPNAMDYTPFADAGGLLSYAPIPGDNLRLAARQVDRILRGAKPVDLPVELPIRQELIVNIATARSMGIAVPQVILVRADRLIE
jgi:putative ABC transport system substrate-binding protein